MKTFFIAILLLLSTTCFSQDEEVKRLIEPTDTLTLNGEVIEHTKYLWLENVDREIEQRSTIDKQGQKVDDMAKIILTQSEYISDQRMIIDAERGKVSECENNNTVIMNNYVEVENSLTTLEKKVSARNIRDFSILGVAVGIAIIK